MRIDYYHCSNITEGKKYISIFRKGYTFIYINFLYKVFQEKSMRNVEFLLRSVMFVRKVWYLTKSLCDLRLR